MGLIRGMIKLLMREGNNTPFSGRLLTAGRQDVFATCQDIQQWAKEMDFQLKSGVQMDVANKEIFRDKEFVTDDSLFLSLGFDSVESIDYSDFEKCTVVHDLNTDVPTDIHNRYDVIIDSGTSEHIFNLPKVFENYNKMLKVGGRIIHISPSSNHVDHGFYMFSPTLFPDYYSANRWKIKDSLFIRFSLAHDLVDSPFYDTIPWEVYEYIPGNLHKLSMGGFDGMGLIFFVAQKNADSTFDASVQQGFYVREWNIKFDDLPNPARTFPSTIRNVAKMLPKGLRKVLAPVYNCLRSNKVPLKLVAKF